MDGAVDLVAAIRGVTADEDEDCDPIVVLFDQDVIHPLARPENHTKLQATGLALPAAETRTWY